MNNDEPRVGMVIRHAYLWRAEAARGQEEGLKDRPCLIMHVRPGPEHRPEVFISPITHTEQPPAAKAVEIPATTCARLKLDAQRQWIVTNEVNRFTWPGHDLRRTPDGGTSYGMLPHGLTAQAVEQLRDHSRNRTLATVQRESPVDEFRKQMRSKAEDRTKPERER